MIFTYGDLIAAAAGKLRAAGIDQPRREARRLIQLAYDLTAADVIAADRETPPEGAANVRFSEYVKRRSKREPLQHIEGRVSFYGLDLLCDARALIPRDDTETVVEVALALDLPEAARIADLGTGSGCILLALLSHRPGWSGVGLEISSDAAELARENIARTRLGARAGVIDEMWEGWEDWSAADLIVSNPPYIDDAVYETLSPEVRHDPLAALVAEEGGLADYRSIFTLAAERMKPGAWLVVEIGFDQGRSVPDLAASCGLPGASVTKDLGGNDRVVSLQIPSK